MQTGCVAFLAANASYSHTNLAGWRLRAAVSSTGWKWHEVEVVQGEPFDRVLRELLRCEPDVVAASFYIFNRHYLCRLLPRLKILRPGLTIIGGGPEFLGDNRRFLEQNPFVDLVVRGEGERAFAEWIECFRAPEKWADIRGLCYISRNRYRDNGRAVPPDLARMASPYAAMPVPFVKPFLLLESARGCSNRCAFCTSAGDKTRFVPVALVEKDLAIMASAGVRDVHFADRTFNERPGRAVTLLRLMRGKFKNMRFHLEIDPARLGKTVMEELRRAPPGQLHLEAGIQTTRVATLKAIGRAGSAAKAMATLAELCGMQNLAVHVDLLAGLPGATLDDLFSDFAAVALLEPDAIQIEIVKILPGTRLRKQPGDILWTDDPPYEALRTGAMSCEDLAEANRLANFSDWFYNVPGLRACIARAVRLDPAFCRTFMKFAGAELRAAQAPSMENRFSALARYAHGHMKAIMPLLGYHWLKLGLSPTHGIVPARPWKGPIPQNAALVEGSPAVKICRVFTADLERTYFFAYGQQPKRGACAIYAAP